MSQRVGAVTTEGISILINESWGGCSGNRRYSILINESGWVRDNRGISITN